MPPRMTLPLKLTSSLSTRLLCGTVLSLCTHAVLADYYPDESRRRHEEGLCVVKMTVTAEGNIEDPTVTLSTGYPRLDQACLDGVRGRHMKPLMHDGKPVAITTEMPIEWRLSAPGLVRIKVDPNNLPRVGKTFYPEESERLREEGLCIVKVKVTAKGEVHALGITHSTGFPRLDQACMVAFVAGGLLPATVNGRPVDSVTENPLHWWLGDSKPAASEQKPESSRAQAN